MRKSRITTPLLQINPERGLHFLIKHTHVYLYAKFNAKSKIIIHTPHRGSWLGLWQHVSYNIKSRKTQLNVLLYAQRPANLPLTIIGARNRYSFSMHNRFGGCLKILKSTKLWNQY